MPIPLPTCRAHRRDRPVRVAALAILALAGAEHALAADEPYEPGPLAVALESRLRRPDSELRSAFIPPSGWPASRPGRGRAELVVSGRAWPFAVGAAADALTTSWALERGAYERNPFLVPGRLDLAMVKLVQFPLLAKIADAIEARRPRLGRWFRYAALVLHGALAAHNVRMGRAAARGPVPAAAP